MCFRLQRKRPDAEITSGREVKPKGWQKRGAPTSCSGRGCGAALRATVSLGRAAPSHPANGRARRVDKHAWRCTPHRARAQHTQRRDSSFLFGGEEQQGQPVRRPDRTSGTPRSDKKTPRAHFGGRRQNDAPPTIEDNDSSIARADSSHMRRSRTAMPTDVCSLHWLRTRARSMRSPSTARPHYAMRAPH